MLFYRQILSILNISRAITINAVIASIDGVRNFFVQLNFFHCGSRQTRLSLARMMYPLYFSWLLNRMTLLVAAHIVPQRDRWHGWNVDNRLICPLDHWLHPLTSDIRSRRDTTHVSANQRRFVSSIGTAAPWTNRRVVYNRSVIK